MGALLVKLDSIIGLLEQINTITTNQMTVLLSRTLEESDEEEKLGLLEQMVEYKEELILEVEKVEIDFDVSYQEYKGKISNKEYISIFKEKVEYILEVKNRIVENEKSNLMIMQSKARRPKQVMSIPKSSKKVAELYKNSEYSKKLKS